MSVLLAVPKPLRDALTFLASEDKVGYLVASLQEELENSDPKAHQAEEENHPSFNPCSEDDVVLPDINWEEGVEEFSCFPQADLWNALGISDSAVPFFNKKMDPDGQHDPWTEEGHNWFEQSENGIPLQLRWHQLVGVVKMMENAFLGKPILLMDGVGLGKTIQVAAFLALLIWFREYYQVHGKFPGKFGAYDPFFLVLYYPYFG
jgi:SNF2 family DNA or RNA helicase